jgi:hypothetical protein
MRELALGSATMAEKQSSVRRSSRSALAVAVPLLLAACNQTGGLKFGWEMFTSSLEPNLQQRETAFTPVGGVSREALDACHRTIAGQAVAHGAIQVEVVSAGTPSRLPNGVNEAPIQARITYRRADQVQIRQANVTCQRDDTGSVVALLSSPPVGP